MRTLYSWIIIVKWRISLVVSLWSKAQTHDGDVSLDLALSVGQVSLGWHGVSSLHRVDDGDVWEQHDQHGDEEAEDEDGDDEGLVDGGVVGFDPVDLTRTVSTIWPEHNGDFSSRLTLSHPPHQLITSCVTVGHHTQCSGS